MIDKFKVRVNGVYTWDRSLLGVFCCVIGKYLLTFSEDHIVFVLRIKVSGSVPTWSST